MSRYYTTATSATTTTTNDNDNKKNKNTAAPLDHDQAAVNRRLVKKL